MQQSSGVSARRGRDDDVERRLATVAAVLWVVTFLLVFWADQNRLAPSEGLVLAEGLVASVLAAVVMPFAIGAYVVWLRRAHRHSVLAAAAVAVLAQLAWLVMVGIAGMIFDPQRIAYTSSEPIEILMVLLVFGVDGAVIGAVGGGVTAFVQRRLARIGGALLRGG